MVSGVRPGRTRPRGTSSLVGSDCVPTTVGAAVARTDVRHVIRIPIQQIGRFRIKSDIPAVSADNGRGTDSVPLVSRTAQAYALGHIGPAVVHEDIPEAVCVTLNEVGDIGPEGYVAAVGAGGGIPALMPSRPAPIGVKRIP